MMAIFAEKVAFRVKKDYFRACLDKDANFYDQNNPNEMSSRIAKEASGMQRGIGEKFGNIFMSFSSFILGYVFAFYFGWIMTLIHLAGLPVMLLVGAGMGIVA